MSTAQDLPGLYGEPLAAPLPVQPTLRLVPAAPLDFDDAVRRVRPRLHRYAIRRLGDSHEAEELVQEALLRAYTHREQLLTEEDLSAWATVVTGRLVIDRLRVRGRSTSVADVPEGSRVGRDTADVVVARDEARTALDALDAMPARQASLLWAREVEGKSYEELCQQFEMTEPAVRSVLTRARKALRKEYASRGGTLPVGGLAVLAPWITGLTWAAKLRHAANRITAPAVLGAAGIAALGGLVLSPFGAGAGGSTTTFTPAQAVVSSHVGSAAVRPTAATTTTKTTATRRAAATSPAGAASSTTRTNTTPIGKPIHDVTGAVGCTSAGDEGLQHNAHNAARGSIGLGNGGCAKGSSSVGVAVPEPITTTTGYDALTLDQTLVSCTDISPLTQTAQIQCSETQP